MFGVFRAKNHDFTPKKSYFFPIAKVGANIFGVFRVKNHDFTQNNYIFSNFRGGARVGCAPPPPSGSAPVVLSMFITTKVVSSILTQGGVYSIQHYVIKFVSDLRQVVFSKHEALALVPKSLNSPTKNLMKIPLSTSRQKKNNCLHIRLQRVGIKKTIRICRYLLFKYSPHHP
jgi:hypothetical protein